MTQSTPPLAAVDRLHITREEYRQAKLDEAVLIWKWKPVDDNTQSQTDLFFLASGGRLALMVLALTLTGAAYRIGVELQLIDSADICSPESLN